MIDVATTVRYRNEASDDLERRAANARGATPSQQQIKMLLDPKDGRIVALCDALLEVLDGAAR